MDFFFKGARRLPSLLLERGEEPLLDELEELVRFFCRLRPRERDLLFFLFLFSFASSAADGI